MSAFRNICVAHLFSKGEILTSLLESLGNHRIEKCRLAGMACPCGDGALARHFVVVMTVAAIFVSVALLTDLFGCRSGSTYAIVYLLRTHNVLLFPSHTIVCLRVVLFFLPCNSAHIAPLKYHEQICVSLKGSCRVKIVSVRTHFLSGLFVSSYRTRSETGQLGQNVFVQTLEMCFRRVFGARHAV